VSEFSDNCRDQWTRQEVAVTVDSHQSLPIGTATSATSPTTRPRNAGRNVRCASRCINLARCATIGCSGSWRRPSEKMRRSEPDTMQHQRRPEIWVRRIPGGLCWRPPRPKLCPAIHPAATGDAAAGLGLHSSWVCSCPDDAATYHQSLKALQSKAFKTPYKI